MSEFATELEGRAQEALASLREAEAAEDDYLVEVRVGELQSLSRLADDHDVTLPAQVADAIARHGLPTELTLPDGEPSPTGPIVLDAEPAGRNALTG
jgi:hypothetical protein